MTRTRARVHPQVRAFDRAAEAYEQGRPDYPRTAVRFLARKMGIGPGRIVVELGSGTGKLTRSLVGTGAAVVAVEPTAGMRRVFRRELPSTLVVDGTAEAIPLPDGCADGVVAAQAFQWFRTRPALREIHRILRPGGWLGLLWNLRLPSTDLSRSINELHARYEEALSPSRRPRWGRRWKAALQRGRYGFGPLRERSFPHRHTASRETLVRGTLSESAVATLSARRQAEAAAEVRAILGKARSAGGRRLVRIPYRTEVYLLRRATWPRPPPRRGRRRRSGTTDIRRTWSGSGRPSRRRGRGPRPGS